MDSNTLQPLPAAIVGGYVAVGIWFAIHLVRSLRLSTTGIAPALQQRQPPN